PDLAVTVAISTISEFEGNERIRFRREPLWALGEDLVDERSTDERRQELIQDDPLIIPACLARGGFERAVRLRPPGPHVVDERVVDLQHREVHLRHQEVRVVTWISDDSHPFRISRNIHGFGPQQELGGIVALKEKWMADRAVAVQTV